MQWVAPPGKDAANDALGKRLWEAADMFSLNSNLRTQQYFGPVLGLTVLRFRKSVLRSSGPRLKKGHRGSRLEGPAQLLPVLVELTS
jgi:type I restriction enzyme M protein